MAEANPLNHVISAAGLALENESLDPNRAPKLGAAFEVFRAQWGAGERDRELALHLMFLAWYLCLEPSHITGLEEGAIPPDDLTAVFNAAHDWLLPTGADTEDAEALYVAGLAAGLCPWALLVNARKRGNLRRPDLGTDARMRGNLRRVRGLG